MKSSAKVLEQYMNQNVIKTDDQSLEMHSNITPIESPTRNHDDIGQKPTLGQSPSSGFLVHKKSI